jgi:hypothetical protein
MILLLLTSFRIVAACCARLGLYFCLRFVAGCQPVDHDQQVPAENRTTVEAESLPGSDPVEFLQKCLKHYDEQRIEGYRAIFQKQERVEGQLYPLEVIQVAFRAHPYSVFMHWLQGARRASGVLYVEGQNGDRMLVHPTGLAGVFKQQVALDPNGPQAWQSERYGIKDFGLRKTLERTLNNWRAAKVKGTLRAEYRGIQEISETGDRPCYVLQATSHEPQKDGIVETTVLIDQDTWLQVGTVLHGQSETLLGQYMYRDIEINPQFAPDQFNRAALSH